MDNTVETTNSSSNTTNSKVAIDSIIAQKMCFIYNALEDGWEVKKKGNNYVFKKRHHNRREVFLDSYLEKFIRNNLNIETIIG